MGEVSRERRAKREKVETFDLLGWTGNCVARSERFSRQYQGQQIGSVESSTLAKMPQEVEWKETNLPPKDEMAELPLWQEQSALTPDSHFSSSYYYPPYSLLSLPFLPA